MQLHAGRFSSPALWGAWHLPRVIVVACAIKRQCMRDLRRAVAIGKGQRRRLLTCEPQSLFPLINGKGQLAPSLATSQQSTSQHMIALHK